jgi:hypothetical protein
MQIPIPSRFSHRMLRGIRRVWTPRTEWLSAGVIRPNGDAARDAVPPWLAALSGGSRRRQVSLNRIRQALAAPSTLHITLAEPPTFRVEARQHPFVFEKSVPWEVAGGARTVSSDALTSARAGGCVAAVASGAPCAGGTCCPKRGSPRLASSVTHVRAGLDKQSR